MSELPLHDPLGRSRTEIKVEMTMAAIVLLSAMSGNMLVVYVINRDSRFHKVTYMFIHNLALTDIALAMTSMPFWIASLSTNTWNPYLFRWSAVSYHQKLAICIPENSVYKITSAGGILIGLTIIIFYCNFKVYKAVRESTRNLNAHAEGNGVRCANDSCRSNMADVSVLKTCVTVACFFVLTWSPISIITVIWTLGFDIPQTFHTTSAYLAFSSSLVNPIIYGFINPQFKVAFKKALSCSRFGNGNTDQNHSRNGVRREVARGLGTAA